MAVLMLACGCTTSAVPFRMAPGDAGDAFDVDDASDGDAAIDADHGDAAASDGGLRDRATAPDASDVAVAPDRAAPDVPLAPRTQRSCTPEVAGCGLVEITGGTFTMGSDIDCATAPDDPSCVGDGSPAQPMITVGSFALDAYEVTVARFNAFWRVRDRDLAEIRRTPIVYPGGQRITWEEAAQPPAPQDEFTNWSMATTMRDAHPMNNLDWWAQQEFCVWDGGRLPTQAEWEFAARGRAVSGLAAGRLYAWGDDPPTGGSTMACDRAQCLDCVGEDGGRTRRVGRFADTGGLFDLTGNVAEWTADWYAPYTSTSCWGGRALTNPLCMDTTNGGHVIYGGSWYYGAGTRYLRAASRISGRAALASTLVGFRCARTR